MTAVVPQMHQAITADTVIAYVTHDDRPRYIINVEPAWSEAMWRPVNL